jgi:hypothetical protein
LGEYCWAITQAAGRSYCCRSGLSVLELGFKMESVVYKCIFDHICSRYRQTKNSTYARPSNRQLLRNSRECQCVDPPDAITLHMERRIKVPCIPENDFVWSSDVTFQFSPLNASQLVVTWLGVSHSHVGYPDQKICTCQKQDPSNSS